MKKALIIISLMFFLVPGFVNATPWKVDDSINVVQWIPSVLSGVGNTSGGLATMYNNTNKETIYTFCLELNEYTNPTMYVADTSDDIAYKGGRYTDSLGSTVPNDQLSGTTKWLYYQFLTGNITGNDNIRALALAIWYLEDEYYDVQGNSLNDWKNWYMLRGGNGAIADIAISYITDATKYHSGYTNSQIRVLDTYYFDNGKKTLGQSFLIFVPEPASMLLLGIGLFGIGLVSRKKK